jgi:hypothetical protein
MLLSFIDKLIVENERYFDRYCTIQLIFQWYPQYIKLTKFRLSFNYTVKTGTKSRLARLVYKKF